MKKLFRIVFFYDQFSIKEAFKSNVLFENKSVAEEVAHKIAKDKKFYWQLEEFNL